MFCIQNFYKGAKHMSAHILSVLVQNHSGVLSKISGLFSRRCFNIDSLTVGETDNPAISRMTIVAQGDSMAIEQIKNQLAKLIDVITVVELGDRESVRRELALIKVKADQSTRVHVMEIANIFRGRIVDVCPESLTLEVTGDQEKIDGIVEMLKPYSIIEIVRTGIIALERGTGSLTDSGPGETNEEAEQ
jgi:acetolactate synthase I/III small subunit